MENQLALSPDLSMTNNFIFDENRFRQMMSMATVMAQSSLIPETLCTEKVDGKTVRLPEEIIQANCFLIVNQAVRWQLDPFSVAQCASVVYGRLMFEGKLVYAVLQKNLNLSLKFAFGKWDSKKSETDLSLEGDGDNLAIRVYEGTDSNFGRYIDGHVGGWKTTGNNSPWQKNARMMLRYRGSREWARAFEPGTMLGVVTDDEYEPAYSAPRDITPATEQASGTDIIARLRASQNVGKSDDGFNADRIQETAEQAKPVSEGVSVSKPNPSAVGEVSASPTNQSEKPEAEPSSPACGGADTASSSQVLAPTNSDEAMEWVFKITAMLWAAARDNRDPDLLKNQRKAANIAYPKPDSATEYHTKKLASVSDRCFEVVNGAFEAPEALKLISGMIGRTEVDIEALAFRGGK